MRAVARRTLRARYDVVIVRREIDVIPIRLETLQNREWTPINANATRIRGNWREFTVLVEASCVQREGNVPQLVRFASAD